MKDYKILLFDLDGTLSDPKEGITKSVQYALEKMGLDEVDLDQLECFIGPPLHVSFKDFYSFEDNDIQKAIRYYRERFKERGMFENELYEGISLLLKELKGLGYTLVVATSKPTVFALEILHFFKIAHYFDDIVGSNLDGTRSSKADIIEYIIEQYHSVKKESFVMIGDRMHDIIGAKEIEIDSIGVSYGYGSVEELQKVKPTYIINSVEELNTLLKGE